MNARKEIDWLDRYLFAPLLAFKLSFAVALLPSTVMSWLAKFMLLGDSAEAAFFFATFIIIIYRVCPRIYRWIYKMMLAMRDAIDRAIKKLFGPPDD